MPRLKVLLQVLYLRVGPVEFRLHLFPEFLFLRERLGGLAGPPASRQRRLEVWGRESSHRPPPRDIGVDAHGTDDAAHFQNGRGGDPEDDFIAGPRVGGQDHFGHPFPREGACEGALLLAEGKLAVWPSKGEPLNIPSEGFPKLIEGSGAKHPEGSGIAPGDPGLGHDADGIWSRIENCIHFSPLQEQFGHEAREGPVPSASNWVETKSDCGGRAGMEFVRSMVH